MTDAALAMALLVLLLLAYNTINLAKKDRQLREQLDRLDQILKGLEDDE